MNRSERMRRSEDYIEDLDDIEGLDVNKFQTDILEAFLKDTIQNEGNIFDPDYDDVVGGKEFQKVTLDTIKKIVFPTIQKELLDTTLWPEDVFNSKDTIDNFQKELLGVFQKEVLDNFEVEFPDTYDKELLDTFQKELFDTFQKNLQDTIQKELLDTNDTIDTNVGVKKVNISGDQKSKSLAPIVNTKREPINNNKRTFKKSVVQKSRISGPVTNTKRAPLNTRKGIVHKIVDQKRRILRPIVNTKRKFSNRIVDQKRRVLRPIINTKRKFLNRIVDQKRRILGPIIRPLIDLKQKKLGYLKSILIKKKNFLGGLFG